MKGMRQDNDGSRVITYECGHTDKVNPNTTLGEILQAIGGLCPTCTFRGNSFPELEPKERKTATARRKS